MELVHCYRALRIDTDDEAPHFVPISVAGQRDTKTIIAAVNFLAHYLAQMAVAFLDLSYWRKISELCAMHKKYMD